MNIDPSSTPPSLPPLHSQVPSKHPPPKPKLNLSLIKNIKNITSLMNNSSSYWKNTFENALCNCNRTPLESESNPPSQSTSIKKPPSLFKITPPSLPPPKPLPSFSTSLPLPSYTKDWSKQENDILLYNYFTLNNKDIPHLTELLPSKSSSQIISRIKKYELRNKTKQYSRQDDLKIIEYVDIYGKNWNKIAMFFPGSTPEMLENRYKNKLDPKLKRTKFTKEEDEKVMALYSQFGNKWKEIASFFPDRNVTMIKNRFYSYLKKKMMLNGNGDNVKSNVNGDNNSSSYGNSWKGEDTYSSVNDANSIICVNNDFTNTIEEDDGGCGFMFGRNNELNTFDNSNVLNNNISYYNDNNYGNPNRNINITKINEDLFFDEPKQCNSPYNNMNNNSLNNSLNKSTDYFFRQNSSTSNINYSFINNNNDFFMETYNKVFPMKSSSSDIFDNKTEYDDDNMFSISPPQHSNTNNNEFKAIPDNITTNIDDIKKTSSPSTNKKELEETHKLFKESINLEDILHKIDSMQNNFNINAHMYFPNEGDLSYKVNQVYMGLMEKKEKAEKYQELLYDKLNKLKQDYVQSLKKKMTQTGILLEINNTLLKLISIAKVKIVLSKQMNDFIMSRKGSGGGKNVMDMQID